MAARLTAPLEGGASSSLAVQLGLDSGELDLLGDFFAEMAAARGIESRRVFAKLKEGAPLGKALGVSPQAAEFLYFRACNLFQAGRPEKAELIFRALCVLDPERADFWAGLGVCLRVSERWDEALAAFGKAAQKRPGWAVPQFRRLEIFVRQGAWDKAASEMAAFEAAKPFDLPPQFAIEAEKYKKAIEKHRLRLPGKGERP